MKTEKNNYSICVDENDFVVFSTTDYDEFKEYLHSSEYENLNEPSWIYATLTNEEYEEMFPMVEKNDGKS